MTAGNWAVVHHLGWDEVPSGTCGGATYGDEKTRRVNGGNRQTFHWGLVTKNMVWWTMIIPSPQRTHPIFVGKVNDGVSPKFGQSPTCFFTVIRFLLLVNPPFIAGLPIFLRFPELRSKDYPFFGPRFCSLRLGICREWLVQQHVRLCWMSLGRGLSMACRKIPHSSMIFSATKKVQGCPSHDSQRVSRLCCTTSSGVQ